MWAEADWRVQMPRVAESLTESWADAMDHTTGPNVYRECKNLTGTTFRRFFAFEMEKGRHLVGSTH